MDETRLDDRVVDLFFDRQRRDIVDRILRGRAIRRRRVLIATLAASLLFAALTSFTIVDRGPSEAPAPLIASLWGFPSGVAGDDDPLAVFGTWGGDDTDPEFLEALALPDLDVDADAVELFPELLPSLEELVPAGDAERSQKG